MIKKINKTILNIKINKNVNKKEHNKINIINFKKLFFLLITFMLLLIVTGCTKNKKETIEIKEETFLAQMNEIFQNKNKYIGDTIILEGIFYEDSTIESNTSLYAIYRNSPGCCGNDGVAGFDLLLSQEELPNNNDWVKVTGVLKSYEINKSTYLRLNVKEIEVLNKRGKEFVID